MCRGETWAARLRAIWLWQSDKLSAHRDSGRRALAVAYFQCVDITSECLSQHLNWSRNVCKTNRLHPRIKESETREERQRRSSRVFNVDLVTHSTRCVFPTTTFSKEDTECVVAAQKQSHCVVAVCNYCLLRPVPVCLSGCFFWLSRPSVGTPVINCASLWTDLSIEAVPGAAAVSVPVSPAAAAVSVQPGEGATEPTAQR